VRAFAEALGAPVFVTPKAKGIFPEDHPLFFGVCAGVSGDAVVCEWLGRADVLVGVGFDPVESDKVWHHTMPLVSIGPMSSERQLKIVDDHVNDFRDNGAKIEIGTLPVVVADEGQIAQVLQNLIGNALKFRGEREPVVRVNAGPSAGGWKFSVEDNGIGIESTYAERVFQMFQRLHDRQTYEGNGIGLTIAKKIVERHGGRIWFESVPGQGTTFFFTLPARQEKAA